jgi:hypothetical protein
MSEQLGAPSVAEPVEPGAQQPEGDELTALRRKLELVQSDNLNKGEANRKLNERLGELERQLKQRDEELRTDREQKLAASGEFRELWESANAEGQRLKSRIDELEAALQAKEVETESERLRASAMQQLSAANALAPDQLYGLLASQLRNTSTGPSVIVNGIEQPLPAYLASLRSAGSGWEHHFAPTGVRGMGTTVSSSSVMPGKSNPYAAASFNLTEALQLEAENPDLAQLMRAEAGRG